MRAPRAHLILALVALPAVTLTGCRGPAPTATAPSIQASPEPSPASIVEIESAADLEGDVTGASQAIDLTVGQYDVLWVVGDWAQGCDYSLIFQPVDGLAGIAVMEPVQPDGPDGKHTGFEKVSVSKSGTYRLIQITSTAHCIRPWSAVVVRRS